jgi:hypothetical protein
MLYTDVLMVDPRKEGRRDGGSPDSLHREWGCQGIDVVVDGMLQRGMGEVFDYVHCSVRGSLGQVVLW